MFNPKLDKFSKKNPTVEVDSEELLIANGGYIFDRKQMVGILNLSIDRIKDYEKKGMPRSEYSTNGIVYYNLKDVMDWILVNVDISKSKRVGAKEKIVDTDYSFDESSLKDIDSISMDEAERRKKIADLKLANIKLEEAEKKLIPADDVDKAMTEQALMHKTKLNNDEKILPILLGLTDSQVHLLHEHNNDHLETLDKQITQRYKKDITNFDVFNEVLNARAKKVMPIKLVKAIQDTYKKEQE